MQRRGAAQRADPVGRLLAWFQSLSHRRRLGVGLGITWLAVTLPFVSVLTGRRTAMYADINDAHVPLMTTAWRAIRQGDSPFWTPLVYAGHNLLGAGQAAIFYPPNALFGWFHPITAFRCWLLFHVWLAAAGAFAWSWHRWRSLPGAIVSGIAYGLNGFIILHIVHMPLVASAAWLPWLFLGLDLVIERWTLRRAGLVAGSIAAIAFTGHPQGLWQALMAVGILAVAQLAWARRGWTAWLRAGGAVAIGGCLGAVQILPLYLFSRTSARPKLSMQAAFLYSDEPRHLLTFAVPGLLGKGAGPAWGPSYHELGNYLGMTVIALAVIAVIGLGRDRRSVGLICVGLFGLVTALAGTTVIGRWVYDYVPLARSFRAWARNAILLNAAVACLAGAGVRSLLATPARWRRGLVIAAASVAVVLGLLPSLTDLGDSIVRGSDAFYANALPVVLLVSLAIAAAAITKDRRTGAAFLIVVCAADLIGFAVSAPWTRQSLEARAVEERYSADPPATGLPEDEPGGIDRWVTDSWLLRAVSLSKNVPGITSYDPLIQADFATVAAGLVDNGKVNRSDFWSAGWLSDVLRVTTVIGSFDVDPTDPTWQLDSTLPGGFVRWTRVPRLAESYLVGDVQQTTFDRIRQLLADPTTDLRQTAYVERDPDRLNPALGPNVAGASGTVVSGAMQPDGHGRWDVTADRPSLFVTSYAWLEGWSATVDGHDAPVVRVNDLVLGVPVPAGQHTVRLRFTPPGFHVGAVLFLLGLLALVTPSTVGIVRRSRVRTADTYGD